MKLFQKICLFFTIIVINYICCCSHSKGYPYGNTKNDFIYYPLYEISSDSTYGYTPENPICVGGDLIQGQKNEILYLNALLSHKGKYIKYERLGSCCPFNTPNAHFGSGLLDKYKITYSILNKPIILYLNMYDRDSLKAPVGFRFKK